MTIYTDLQLAADGPWSLWASTGLPMVRLSVRHTDGSHEDLTDAALYRMVRSPDGTDRDCTEAELETFREWHSGTVAFTDTALEEWRRRKAEAEVLED